MDDAKLTPEELEEMEKQFWEIEKNIDQKYQKKKI